MATLEVRLHSDVEVQKAKSEIKRLMQGRFSIDHVTVEIVS